MKNLTVTVKGNKVTVTFDKTSDFGPSSSGKSLIIASTEGNVSLPGHPEIKLGINVYKKP